jgi:hypothetical protein
VIFLHVCEPTQQPDNIIRSQKLSRKFYFTSNRHLNLRNIQRALFSLRGWLCRRPLCNRAIQRPQIISCDPYGVASSPILDAPNVTFRSFLRALDRYCTLGLKVRCVTWLGKIHVRHPTAGGSIKILVRRVPPRPRELELPLTCG